MKVDGHKRISIKKKRRYITFRSLIACILILCSIILVSFLVNKIIIDNEMDKLDGKEVNDKSDDDAYKVIESVTDSIVTISDDKAKLQNNIFNEGNVSGVILNKDGYILTSYNSIKGKNKLYVRLSGVANEPIEAKIIGNETETDIAVIKISADNLVPIKFSNYDEIKVGEKVFAVGNAVSASPIGMIAPGIITSVNETITDGNNNSYRLIETSAVVNKKNVGGVLCNSKGELVGFINEVGMRLDEDTVLNFTLGVKGVENICEYLVNLTDILGINGGNAIDDQDSGVKGVYIQNIKKDGYAAKAGLLPTDIITAIDGKEVETPEDLYYAVKNNQNRDNIKCDFLRDGAQSSVNINLK